MTGESVLAVVEAQPTGSRAVAAADFNLTSIDLYICSSCNRRCSYCFLSDQYLASGARMDLDMIQSILDWAAQGSVREITLLGGEPGLHRDFESIVSLVATAGFEVRTVTNGSPQFRKALDNPAVAAAMTRVAVSLDAPSEAAVDNLRGPRAFSSAMATIEKLKSLAIPYQINCTVLRSTLPYFADMMSFAEGLGATRLNVHWFSLVGRAQSHAPGEELTPAQWRTVLEQARAYRPSSADYVVDCELAFAYGLPGEDVNACAVRDRANLQFFPDGAVFSCGMLINEAGRSGYHWRGERLVENAGATEVSDAQIACGKCPQRDAVVEGDHTYTPLCIYNRLVH